MNQEQPSKYERKKLRREEKEERRMQGRRNKQWMQWLLLALGAGALSVGIFFIINNKNNGKQNISADLSVDLSRAMSDEGNAHVAEGTDVTHQSNPPTS
ncbi:MAG TPA: hypothetical protein VI954_02160, partial [Candidatus Paceibacterota bacterium]